MWIYFSAMKLTSPRRCLLSAFVLAILAEALLSCATARPASVDTLGSAPPCLDPAQVELFDRFGGKFATIEGVRTHYFEFGGDGKAGTFLFVHGYAGTGLEVFCVAPSLVEAGYRVVAPDWPGAGLSELLPECSMEAYVAWLETFRRALGIEDFVLAGHSLGGFLAARYAAAYPESLRALVLLAPAGFEKEIGTFLAALADSPPLVETAMALYIPWY